MKHVLELQKAFYNEGHTHSIKFRIKQLSKLEYLLKQHLKDFEEAIYADFKKSAFENYVSEFALLFQDIKEAKKNLYKWARNERVGTNFMNFPACSYIIKQPLGVCLIIGAWNYPYQLSFAPLIAAIAAGNTIVLKPSELPSRTSAAIAKVLNTNFNPAFIKVIEGGVPVTTELLKLKFDKIFFTGSTKVGAIVYQAAAKNLIPVTLELGGKSPAIITEDANLKMTVKRLVWAKFLNAGQTCIAPDYVMVHERIKQKFLEAAKAEIEKAQYAFNHHNYVQIINNENFDRLSKLIDSKKVFMGGSFDKATRYIEPTILNHVTFSDLCMQEEIFGPILPVLSFNTIEEAIIQIKKLPKPLSAYIFTKNKKIKNAILNQISFGGGAVNDAVMHITNSKLPFGGVGQSGIGKYHGEAGFKTFTHCKSILDKPTWIEFPLKYSPYSKSKLKWIKRLLKLQ